MNDRGKIIRLPINKEDILKLHVGDYVLISGIVVTGRDRVHKYLSENKGKRIDFKYDLNGLIIYHCGPVVEKTKDGYKIISAGPTTSMRMEMYEDIIISRYGIRGVMGKGGMGDKTIKAMKRYGCVYFNTIGGAGTYLAERIEKVLDVWLLDEFGIVEAMWIFEVEDFPAIVTIDAYGKSLHEEIRVRSFKRFAGLIKS